MIPFFQIFVVKWDFVKINNAAKMMNINRKNLFTESKFNKKLVRGKLKCKFEMDITV
jgi:hypothetical protein